MRHDLSHISITVGDMIDCGWHDAIGTATREGYFGIWQALTKAANTAIAEENLLKGRCLWLLADAVSMMLVPEKLNHPFKPALVLEDRRSAVPEDFSESELRLFGEFTEKVANPWLKSRLADLCWIALKPRDINFALSAIDAYMQIPLDAENWMCGGEQCWERATKLASALKQGAENRQDLIEVSLFNAFNDNQTQSGFFVLWIARVLRKNRLCKTSGSDIANRLTVAAQTRYSQRDFHDAREHWDEALLWLTLTGNMEQFALVNLSLAECWEADADANLAQPDCRGIVAAGFYEKAIQTLRRVPRAQRDHDAAGIAFSRLERKLAAAGKAALTEMKVISSEPINISEMISAAIERVQGKPAIDALAAFVSLSAGARVDRLREQAETKLKRFSFQSLFGATHFSHDGRVVAREAGASFKDGDTTLSEAAIRVEMIRMHRMQIGLIVQGLILPALETLRLEHTLCLQDFVTVAANSSFVSTERAGLLARGLYAGYDGDLVVAVHVLVPQIEELIRWHVKESGAKTTTIDLRGIETENGLGTLLGLPVAEDIFGKDLVFELNSLLCDPLGPNLRNELAHGLISEAACYSSYTVYFWWLILRVTFSPFWNSMHRND